MNQQFGDGSCASRAAMVARCTSDFTPFVLANLGTGRYKLPEKVLHV